MLIITTEYKYYNIKLNERCNIVENTLLKQKQKCTVRCRGMVKVECIADCLDEMRNEIKIITIRSCNINEELNKVLQSSTGIFILVRIDKIRIIIERIVF